MEEFTIKIRVTDPGTTEKKLRWLLEEAGEVVSVQETSTDDNQ